jgi:flagellar protein FlgJ
MSESTPINSAKSYTDFTALGELRGKAQRNEAGAMRESAEQFEALFIQMMLKSMREASFESGLVQSDAMDSYRDMMDKELAVQLSKRGALGIANMLKQQLAPVAAAAPGAPVTKPIHQVAEPMPLPAAKALKIRGVGQ